ncbi:DUF418 domain-containing protein [Archangium violaceum]|uniref:DUF418 domain-containing protein n=1 Tax=Archangium violaceum TaxID=83451 RepID=UPI00193AFB3D|nr:DUF418 domain-containing protein [Archangium violaceum]QRK09471.1 DUF418 domain-containing protein [Archangium violaceum]
MLRPSLAPADDSLRPVDPEERISVLDAIRGFALLGILFANLLSFSGFYVMSPAQLAALPTAELDRLVVFWMDLLVEGKFYSLFSFLFGVGFFLLQERTERRGGDFRRLFLRRMAALLCIGLFHILVMWHGDILTLYALMGFVLLLFRGAADRALLAWALALLVMPFLFQLAMMGTGGALDPTPPFDALSRAIQDAAGGPEATLFSLRSSEQPWQVFLGNLANAVQRPGRYLQTGRPEKVLAMFVLGVWVGRRLLPDPLVHRRLLARVLAGGLVLGLLGNSVSAWIQMETGKSFSLTPLGLVQTLAYAVGVAPLAMAYASGLTLLWGTAWGRRLLSPFVPLGRMALTNYLCQSVLGLLSFYGYGLNLMGRVGAVWMLLLTPAILAVQWGLSVLWLRRHSQGPVEWAWRQLTYGRPRSLRVPAPSR